MLLVASAMVWTEASHRAGKRKATSCPPMGTTAYCALPPLGSENVLRIKTMSCCTNAPGSASNVPAISCAPLPRRNTPKPDAASSTTAASTPAMPRQSARRQRAPCPAFCAGVSGVAVTSGAGAVSGWWGCSMFMVSGAAVSGACWAGVLFSSMWNSFLRSWRRCRAWRRARSRRARPP